MSCARALAHEVMVECVRHSGMDNMRTDGRGKASLCAHMEGYARYARAVEGGRAHTGGERRGDPCVESLRALRNASTSRMA